MSWYLDCCGDRKYYRVGALPCRLELSLWGPIILDFNQDLSPWSIDWWLLRIFWALIHPGSHSKSIYPVGIAQWPWYKMGGSEPLDLGRGHLSGSVWWEDAYVLSLMSPLSLFKRNSTLLPGTEVIVWGRLGSPLVNILFLTKLLSLAPLSWDMDCLLTLWLRLPLVPLVTVAVCLVFWSLSFPKWYFFVVSCTTDYIYS